MAETSLAEETIELCSQLETQRATHDTLWQDISRYVMPSKSDILEDKTPGVAGWTQDIHDISANQANMKLASGSFDFLLTGKWFAYEAPEEFSEQVGKDGRDWYKRCSEIAIRELNRSNWDLEAHEMLLDRGGFGTGAILCEENKGRNGLRFLTQQIGTYSIMENDEKLVDTLVRKIPMTVRNMVQKYGYENCAKKVRELWDKGGKEIHETFEVIHRISPRQDVRKGPAIAKEKPWASIHVDKKHKKLLRVSGYDEMPMAVSRFIRWGKSPWGYCPSVLALPITRTLNLLEKYMDALVEMAAFPRLLIPTNLQGDVDLRSSGITLFDPNLPNALPKEWATQGRYDIGVDRAEKMREFIDDAYHVNLFQALADRTKTMTATEVLELKEEKLVNFSPTFARLRMEIFNPVLLRVFNVLYRQGKFKEPPSSVLAMLPDGTGGPLTPQVSLTSKLALAMKSLENKSFIEFLSMAELLFTIQPESIDRIAEDAIDKLAANAGVAVDFMATAQEIKAKQEARAKQQEAAAMLEAAQGMAKAGKDLSGASPQLLQAVS